MKTIPVDVAVETFAGDFYQFLSVNEDVLTAAVVKATGDAVALSLVNTESAALVIPWKLIKRILCVPVDVEEREDAWETFWEYGDFGETRASHE